MTKKEWAENEVKLALNQHNEDGFVSVDDVHAASFELFCKFCDLTEKMSEKDVAKARFILNQLLDGNPLTPIHDTEDEWNKYVVQPKENGEDVEYYISKRRPTLIKKIATNVYGVTTIEIADTEQFQIIDINSPGKPNVRDHIVHALVMGCFPIVFPYKPTGKIKIYIERFDDCIGVLYFRLPDGQMRKIMRFFQVDEYDVREELTRHEYNRMRMIHKLPEEDTDERE